jgi:multicomponent Na+:H+ antiporter subunit B
MSRKLRMSIFVAAALGLGSLYLLALRGLPAFGHYRGPYGDVLNQVAVYERHATDVVTAVNFDYRGFDTLGEEFILFSSVLGALLLLRAQKREKKDEGSTQRQADTARERAVPQPSEAVRDLTVALVGPLVCFGLYIVLHGQLTPGGGFQGGVILATAPLLVYLAGDFRTFKRIASHHMVEVAEAMGVAGYLAIGFAGMIFSGDYLRNVFPLGETGQVFSSGTIFGISFATGLEVAAGFVLLLYVFLEQTLEIHLGKEQ